jgi:DNA-binding CsgD family transcriptional regulator
MNDQDKNNYVFIADRIGGLKNLEHIRQFIITPDIPCVQYAAFSYWHSWSPGREPDWYASSFPTDVKRAISGETDFERQFETQLYFKQLRPLDWSRSIHYMNPYPKLHDKLVQLGITTSGITAIVRGPVDGFALFYVQFNLTVEQWLRDGICWAGGVQLAGTFLYELIGQLSSRRDIIPLSRREGQCMALAARGMRAKEIAYDLGLSEQSVNLYMTRARLKLGAINTTHAAVRAVKMGLVSTS